MGLRRKSIERTHDGWKRTEKRKRRLQNVLYVERKVAGIDSLPSFIYGRESWYVHVHHNLVNLTAILRNLKAFKTSRYLFRWKAILHSLAPMRNTLIGRSMPSFSIDCLRDFVGLIG